MIKKGDFVELDYVGRVRETNEIFDLTDAETAKKHKLFDERAQYGPVVICIGENTIVRGIDDFLVGKECKEYMLELKPEQGFGKKDPKLFKMMPHAIFQKKNIRPFPGLQLNFDELIGTVRTVSGGRVIVDFNHPLAGRDITYEIKVLRILTTDSEKLAALLHLVFRRDIPFELKQQKAVVKLEPPSQIKDLVTKKILQLIPSIKSVEFTLAEDQKGQQKAPAKKPQKKAARPSK